VRGPWGQLAGDDVEDGDHGECDARGHGVGRRGCEVTQECVERRLNRAGQRRLADPAERKRGDGHAELAGRDVGVEVADHLLGGPGRRAPAVGQLPQPRLSNGHDGELCGDEEAAEQDQADHGHQAGDRGYPGDGHRVRTSSTGARGLSASQLADTPAPSTATITAREATTGTSTNVELSIFNPTNASSSASAGRR
jgi:hypothetical protein